ncbi:hypothetical protein HZ994_16260 [Akkermansiaceae bacterium]|nr:hypothetical protein HZ994_16260 [Akkermansiaceae bacterium]
MSKEPTKPESSRDKKPSKNSTEATETDLWDLDDDDSGFVPRKTAAESAEGLPARRKSESNISSKIPTERHIEIPELTDAQPPAPAPATKAVPEPKPKPKPETAVPVETDSGETESPEGDAESAAVPSLNPLSSLTKTERISIIALASALALAAVLAIIHFSGSVPTRSPITEKTDFPVSGKLVEIRSGSTYWRKPITTGGNADTVRRGTALIPVIKISTSAKSGTIRIFFRDADGIVIGDAINRDVTGDQDFVIPATAGFEDIGMHAAYRTGEQEPWTVQVFEGPSRSADREDFRKILEMQVSTDIR